MAVVWRWGGVVPTQWFMHEDLNRWPITCRSPTTCRRFNHTILGSTLLGHCESAGSPRKCCVSLKSDASDCHLTRQTSQKSQNPMLVTFRGDVSLQICHGVFWTSGLAWPGCAGSVRQLGQNSLINRRSDRCDWFDYR